jgi:hypothetical protein
MARFRAYIKGRQGDSWRLGDDQSGIVAELTAAELGVSVRGYVAADGSDVFELYLTRGRMPGVPYCLGTVTLYRNRPAFQPVSPPTTPEPKES